MWCISSYTLDYTTDVPGVDWTESVSQSKFEKIWLISLCARGIFGILIEFADTVEQACQASTCRGRSSGGGGETGDHPRLSTPRGTIFHCIWSVVTYILMLHVLHGWNSKWIVGSGWATTTIIKPGRPDDEYWFTGSSLGYINSPQYIVIILFYNHLIWSYMQRVYISVYLRPNGESWTVGNSGDCKNVILGDATVKSAWQYTIGKLGTSSMQCSAFKEREA
jgi:hypothetical protein